MNQPLKKIKPVVRTLQPYSLRPDRARVKLNQNENPWDVPAAIKVETLRRLANCSWSRYPEFAPERLKQRLAEYAGWISDGILAGNGSNELIQAVLMTTLSAGKRVLISEPTFALYRQIGTVLEAEVDSLPLTSEFEYDIDCLQRA